MGVEMAEKMKEHTFRIQLSESDSVRLEAYLCENGMKKRFFMQKAIRLFLDENEQKSEN